MGQWNFEKPSLQIDVHDRILSVNGVSGQCDLLQEHDETGCKCFGISIGQVVRLSWWTSCNVFKIICSSRFCITVTKSTRNCQHLQHMLYISQHFTHTSLHMIILAGAAGLYAYAARSSVNSHSYLHVLAPYF